MLENLEILLEAALFLGIVLFIRWIISIPTTPDPWEGKLDDENWDENARPICPNCSKPINNPRANYCDNCGGVVGEYTRYLPLEGIKFNYSICGTMWRNMCDRNSSKLAKTANLLLLLMVAPITPIIGLAAVCAGKLRIGGAPASEKKARNSKS